ncbi:TIM barrel protein [Pararhizobium sp. BT-229]|uniref:hydroxypyruvate isomerase family protein n=1 Tax=Pararhizobium sp. BT-229 TaxID=2986923 RepID=UPI0021F7CE77|nr:TIM barrel protein [Pararhizobium sp. BT-229]MCV9966898.1 TIM barrel protein [Pararhizobium sp. BT-229]
MMRNRFSAHLGYLFTELPLPERVAAAANAGFTAIEHPQPFAIDTAQMNEALKRHDLQFSQIAAAVGDAAKSEKGLAALSGREVDFREAFKRSLDYALAVGCPLVHPMAGVPTTIEGSIDVYRRNMAFAVSETASTPVKVLIEPISHAAVPGYAVSTIEEAVAIQDEFGADRVRLLVDTFHGSASTVDLPNWLETNAHRVGHVHIADHPGRHEPGTGTFDFDRFLTALETNEYHGAIGFEYVPSTTTSESLRFLSGWTSRATANQG